MVICKIFRRRGAPEKQRNMVRMSGSSLQNAEKQHIEFVITLMTTLDTSNLIFTMIGTTCDVVGLAR